MTVMIRLNITIIAKKIKAVNTVYPLLVLLT
jgi:hypothetical protein